MNRLWVVVSAIALSSCGQTTEIEPPADPVATPVIEARLSAIESRLLALEGSQPNSAAFLPITGDSGYSIVATNHGPLLFAVEAAQPQGNGQAITLRVGNPSAARYHGMTFTAVWGPSFGAQRPADAPELAPIEQRRHQITINEDLMPGAWTQVRFSIGPVRVDDFGMVVVSNVQMDNLSLRN